MKKLMISTIIILPLLLLAILLVSGAIMSLITHIYVETVEFSDNSAIILVMDDEQNPPTFNLSEEITVLPLKATNRDLIYTVSDSNLLEVSDKGIVTARFYGEAYITVQSKENDRAHATRKVIVTDTSVHALVMNEYEKELYEGQSQQLSVNIYPEEANNRALTWKSSDENVLQVSANGMVTAIGNGTATVTATSKDETNGTISATATIKCHAKLEDVIFDRTLLVTSQQQTQFPEIATDPLACDVTVEYSSSNTDIATVDKNGLVTFKTAGKVSITAKVTDFNGSSIEVSKEFVSTFGYFVGTLFNEKEMLSSNFSPDSPIEFARSLELSYQEITQIECLVDGTSADWLDEEYMKQNLVVKFKDDVLPEFEDCIEIKIQAKVYSFKTNTIETYEDCFRICKTPSQVLAKVMQNGEELSTDKEHPTEIEFNNINDKITLEIEELNGLSVEVSDNPYVSIEIGENVITLTSKSVCTNQKLYISVGTKTYVVIVNVQAKAENINVFCDGQQLYQNGEYKTLLDELSFTIKPTRSDGQQLSTGAIYYKVNSDQSWQRAQVANGKITLQTEGVTSVAFKYDDKEISFNLQKTTLEDFGFELSVNTGEGITNLASVSSVKNQELLSYNLPSNIQNNLTISVQLGEDYLGGVGSNKDFAKLFPIALAQGWESEYNAFTTQIVIIFGNGEQEFNKTIKIGTDALNISLQLLKVDIKSIMFTGYDSGNEDDVYLGYQQVGVYAKQSYYNGLVDYFEIPYKALSTLVPQEVSASPETITWNLSRYVGKTMEYVVTTQCGYNVTYFNGLTTENYEIVQVEGGYVLKNAGDTQGKAVVDVDGKNPNGITWVDIYSHPGYARIYFGNFAGLSESDVYNDYFGAFDDQPWQLPKRAVDTKGGNAQVIPSKNAYSFLRVEAGDGAVGGTNCHFNFNVLDDKELVNVFDANGYYENDKIVLHTSLYGPGELDGDQDKKTAAQDAGLFLDREVTGKSVTDKLSKTTIYGNGHQINLMAKNTYLLATTDPSKYGYHNGAAFHGIYNLTLKGSNPTTEVKRANQAMVFRIGNAYYCDIQYLSKINTFYDDAVGDGSRENIGSFSNIKNSVIRYASWCCYQLTCKDDKAYFENVVFVESNTALTMENKSNMGCYFNGFYDVLCYNTLSKICEDKGYGEANAQDAVDATFDKYAEWFGKNNSGIKDQAKAARERYVNPVLFVAAVFDSNKPYFWNGESYTEQSEDLAILFKVFFSFYPGWGYNRTVDFDGGEKVGGYYTSRDMSKLFDNPDAIRLLCEYKGLDEEGNLVKNIDHVMWHINKIQRKPSKEGHIENLTKTLKGTDWGDGTGVDDNGVVYDKTIVAMNKLLSCAITPKKQEI